MSDSSSSDTSDSIDDLVDRVQNIQDRVQGLSDRVQDFAERFSIGSSSSPEPTTTDSLPWSNQAITSEDYQHSGHFPAITRPLGLLRQEQPPRHLPPTATLLNRPPNLHPDNESVSSDSASLSTSDYDDIEDLDSSQPSQGVGAGASHTATNTPAEPIDLTGGSPPRPSSPHFHRNMSSVNTRPLKRRREEVDSDTTDSDGPSASKRRRSNIVHHRAAVSVSAPSERSTFHPPPAPERHYAPPRPVQPPNRTIEQIDLCDDDAPEDEAQQELQRTLQKQRADQVASQAQSGSGTSTNRSSGHYPTPSIGSGTRSGHTKLNSLTCTVCLEIPTDLTATTCGHTFCRTCLLDWLVSSERDQSRRPNCPACRKALTWRPTARAAPVNRDVVPVTFLKRKAVAG